MAEHHAHAAPVLRCPRCNKPFDKQSALKRHEYYCRTRKEGPLPRSKACTTCVRRKSRCDNKRPACSGCVARSLDCQYPTGKGVSRGSRRVEGPANDKPHGVSRAIRRPSLVLSNGGLGSTPSNSLTEEADHELEWSFPVVDLDERVTDTWPTTPNQDILSFSNPSTAPAILPPESFTSTIPALFAPVNQPPYLFGTLTQRHTSTAAPQTLRTAHLVLHTLKSYPLMVLRHDTLPPFIHHRIMASPSLGSEDDDMEPLNNCLSLLHVMMSRVKGSRGLFWRNVKGECERFLGECPGWNKWQLLASLQAAAIYLILRVDEGQGEHSDIDSLLVATVIALAATLGRVKSAEPKPSTTPSLDTLWKNWIHKESLRRLCVIYQVLDLLVYFTPAGMCHSRQESNLLIAPLPSGRRLWEARDGFAWKAEREREKRDKQKEDQNRDDEIGLQQQRAPPPSVGTGIITDDSDDYGDDDGVSGAPSPPVPTTTPHAHTRTHTPNTPSVFALSAAGTLTRVNTLNLHCLADTASFPSPSPSSFRTPTSTASTTTPTPTTHNPKHPVGTTRFHTQPSTSTRHGVGDWGATKTAPSWEDWCADMDGDGLGGLVMLAASLMA